MVKVRWLRERREPTTFLRQPWNDENVTFIPRYDPGERVLTVYVLDAVGRVSAIRTHWDATRAEVLERYQEQFQR